VRKRGLEPPLPCGNKLLRLNKIAAGRGGPRLLESAVLHLRRSWPIEAAFPGVSCKFLQVTDVVLALASSQPLREGRVSFNLAKAKPVEDTPPHGGCR